jgi:hypothetical protein
MTKQSDAKAAQCYVAKPVPSTCGNCAHLKSEMALSPWRELDNERAISFGKRLPWGDSDKFEKNLRCTLGSFATKKMATCNQFAPEAAA